MKIDRLLSLVILLLDREIVRSRELARRFEVSVRTIQRDMESLALAGIPVYAVPGPSGGYGILEGFKLDRRLMTQDDFFAILTALKGVQGSIADKRFLDALEKIRSLLPAPSKVLFSQNEEKLVLDFSPLGGNRETRENLRKLEECIDARRKVRFRYTSHRLESTEEGFRRRGKSFREFSKESTDFGNPSLVDLTLRFHPLLRPMVEEFYSPEEREEDPEGYLTVRTTQPEEQRLYGYILGFGEYVEVLAPERLRGVVCRNAEKIAEIYRAPER